MEQPLSSVERAWFSGYMLAAKERHVRFVTWLTVSPGGRVVKAHGAHWLNASMGLVRFQQFHFYISGLEQDRIRTHNLRVGRVTKTEASTTRP